MFPKKGKTPHTPTPPPPTTPKFLYSEGIFEITVNPADKYQHFHSNQRLQNFFLSTQRLINKVFVNLGIPYTLYVELSMPHVNINKNTKLPRLHYHGTITLTKESSGDLLLHGLYKLSRWCNVTINDYRDDYWPNYATKSKDIMTIICSKNDCPYPLTDKSPQLIFQDEIKFKYSH